MDNSATAKKCHMLKIVVAKLKRKYGANLRTSLDASSPWELLVATMLSAQSQDKQVNVVTKDLFKKYHSVEDYASISPKQLYSQIGSLGLYKNKAKNIVASAKAIVNNFNSQVPQSMDELILLPGVGRKTANVVLYNAFHIREGIAIDTHCITVSGRLKITRSSRPEVIESDLMKLLPKKEWGEITHLFIALGRDTCTAKRKLCARCTLKNICPSSDCK